jgi:hypothetical protein
MNTSDRTFVARLSYGEVVDVTRAAIPSYPQSAGPKAAAAFVVEASPLVGRMNEAVWT